MRAGDMEGWDLVRTATAAGHLLTIAHRRGDDRWRALAPRYWIGALEGLETLRSSPHAVVQKGAVTGDRKTCYFKRFQMRGPADHVKHLFRDSRAKRALQGGELAASLGFRCPRAVCLIEERRFGLLRDSALVTEDLGDVRKMQELVNRPQLGLVTSFKVKRRLLRALGREVGRWHNAGLYHGDMRTSNILCRHSGEEPEFSWIDHERTRRYARLPERRRVHNLVQVNMEKLGMSRTDRLRIWQAYLAETGIPGAEADRIVRKVIAKTRKRWRSRGWL